jgi:hypothetical protein
VPAALARLAACARFDAAIPFVLDTPGGHGNSSFMRTARLAPETSGTLALAGVLASLGLVACGSSKAPSFNEVTVSGASASGGASSSGSGGAAGGADAALGLPPGTAVTYYQHVAPILHARCEGCHQAGAIAPFALSSYEQARMWGPLWKGSIDAGTMPPWGAQETQECQPRLGFKHDRRLTTTEKAVLEAWVMGGMLEGDLGNAAPLPPAESLELTGTSTTLTMPVTVSVEGSQDRFLCMGLDPALSSDVWLTGSQVLAGNKAIVHHVLLFSDPTGEASAMAQPNGYYECFGGVGLQNPELLAAWAPGANAAEMPPEVGIPLKAGTKLVMQIHYHPTGAGAEQDSQTKVALRFTSVEPRYTGSLTLIGNFGSYNNATAGGEGFGLLPGPNDPPSGPRFSIPAGATAHTETQRFLVPGGAQGAALGLEFLVWGVGTHMHYVGRDMKIDVRRANAAAPEPVEECLVQTPAWDFNWQGAYFYDAELAAMPKLRPGDELWLRCTYDNSLGNPFLRQALASQGLDAPVDVTLGESSLEEMCLGIFGVAVESQFAPLLAAGM